MNNSKFLSTREMIQVGMFTAIIAVLAQFSIPMPSGVPASLQTLAVGLIGTVLGSRLGAITLIVYIILGGIGIPVFSNFNAGLGALVGPTSGFLLGFVIYAYFAGLGINSTKSGQILSGIIGLFLCHLLGAIVFSFVTDMGFIKALLLVSAPYILKDLAFYLIAMFLGNKIRPRVGL
jgi:biotin transport system substrate-specific component